MHDKPLENIVILDLIVLYYITISTKVNNIIYKRGLDNDVQSTNLQICGCKVDIQTFSLKVNILVGSFITNWFSFVDMEMTLKVYLSLNLIQNILVYSQA